ncbi:aspartyl-phosphate phosphatase Spo0E family protein [Exiguobacterium sp. s36]|uniref:aspartyl-phosphate phosphatase Spo0E family protein n=1 Tax=Exiguobacterium sp. s36 TaxID=2751227 RepID=UPI001BEBB1F0
MAVITAENLHYAIEQKRDELYEIASQQSWTSPEVIHVSQELDKLITRHVLAIYASEHLNF